MSNKGRVLTLVITVEQDEYPTWIMEAHMKGPQNGVRVNKIAEGDVIKERDELEEKLDDERGEYHAMLSRG